MSEIERSDVLVFASGTHDSDEILGFMAVGPHAGEILAVVQTAMMGKLPYTALRDAVFTHPTMAEGLGPLLVREPALHKPSKGLAGRSGIVPDATDMRS